MPHLFPGFSGVVTAVGTTTVIWVVRYTPRRKNAAYDLDPGGKPGAFEPLLQKYLRLSEFTIGLATGSIVLLVGSSVLHGRDGRLPWFYGSPLLVLAASVVIGLGFMAWLVLGYEEVQHGNPHTPEAYSLMETLGFSSLALFCVGYVWLVIVVTR
jgi:hypothetical protein